MFFIANNATQSNGVTVLTITTVTVRSEQKFSDSQDMLNLAIYAFQNSSSSHCILKTNNWTTEQKTQKPNSKPKPKP